MILADLFGPARIPSGRVEGEDDGLASIIREGSSVPRRRLNDEIWGGCANFRRGYAFSHFVSITEVSQATYSR